MKIFWCPLEVIRRVPLFNASELKPASSAGVTYATLQTWFSVQAQVQPQRSFWRAVTLRLQWVLKPLAGLIRTQISDLHPLTFWLVGLRWGLNIGISNYSPWYFWGCRSRAHSVRTTALENHPKIEASCRSWLGFNILGALVLGLFSLLCSL